MEQPVSVNVNINLTELPKCPCGDGLLLPVMDFTQASAGVIPILKGWFCPKCNVFYTFAMGDMKIKMVTPWIASGPNR